MGSHDRAEWPIMRPSKKKGKGADTGSLSSSCSGLYQNLARLFRPTRFLPRIQLYRWR